MHPRGSRAPASKPQAITISSGAYASSAGTTTRSRAARYAPAPEPAGSGTLRVVPTAAGPPVSSQQARPGRVETVLVERDREHGRVVPEHGLCAVAVVNVPVDDGDASYAPRGLRMADPDGHVREDAEAHPEIGKRVVTGRAHERVGVLDGALENRVDRGDRAAGRELGDLERAVAERSLAARVAASSLRQLLDPVDVLLRVNAQELLDGGGTRRQQEKLVGQAGGIEKILQPPLRGGALGMLAGFEPAARG